jgi:hypothetical protein
LRHHGFEHDAEGKAGPGLEKKQAKTGSQNVPAIEDLKPGVGALGAMSAQWLPLTGELTPTKGFACCRVPVRISFQYLSEIFVFFQ